MWSSFQEHDETVERVIYASRAAVRSSVFQEMEKIRASALRHNDPSGITTALLHRSGWFIQWKEGPRSALQETMQRVAHDERHRDLRIVNSSVGPRLLPGPWSMGIVQCSEPAFEMELRVRKVAQRVASEERLSPPATWRLLSAPMKHPGASRQQDPDAFQRVMICSASGTACFDLVRWLGGQHREEVVHQRYAGAAERDVGTDYVDFMWGSRVLRVIAMARHGLTMPLTRAFIPDFSHLALLLDADPERNAHLMHKVLLAYEHLRAPPPLIGITDRKNVIAQPESIARRASLSWHAACAASPDPADLWRALHPFLTQWPQAAHHVVLNG